MSGVQGQSGPPGNQNARRGRIWRDAIERALDRRGGGDRVKALDELAETFLNTVEAMARGEKPSVGGFTEFGDRVEGKSTQALEHSGPGGEPLSVTISSTDAAL